MHLLHLSANVRGGADAFRESSPESPYSPHQSVIGQNLTQHQFQQAASALSQASFAPPSGAMTANQPPVFAAHPPPLSEEAQLPTPETLMDQGNPDGYHPSYPHPAVEEMARLPFSDFLRDVLYEQSVGDHNRLAEAQGLAVLDFCDDTNLDLKDFDFNLLDHWNVESTVDVANMQQSGPDEAVDMSSMRSRLVKIWTESPWRWNPGKSDTGYNEQSNLPLSSRDAQDTRPQGRASKIDRAIQDTLNSSSRDKILAIVLSNCRENSIRARVAESFPPADAMDSWVHIFLASHMCQVSAWIHYGSFCLNSQWPEWLAIAASAGAIMAPLPTLRRFGFALQEAVRR